MLILAIAAVLLLSLVPSAPAQVSRVPAGGKPARSPAPPTDGESRIVTQDLPSDTLGSAPKSVIGVSWGPALQVPQVTANKPSGQLPPPPGFTIAGKGKQLPYPRPGQDLQLTSALSADLDGTISSYKWTVVITSANLANTSTEQTESTDQNVLIKLGPLVRRVTATLQVVDNTGLQSTAQLGVKVVPNLPPKIALEDVKKIVRPKQAVKINPGSVNPAGQLEVHDIGGLTGKQQSIFAELAKGAVVSKPKTVFANGADSDGSIVSYSYDVSGAAQSDFEISSAALASGLLLPQINFIPREEKEQVIKVRATDDEGATAEAEIRVPVRIRCQKDVATIGGLAVRGLTGCLYTKVTAEEAKKDKTKVEEWEAKDGTVNVNGLQITSAKTRILTGGGVTYLKSAEAFVDTVSPSGQRLHLSAGKLNWAMAADKHIYELVNNDQAYAGLNLKDIEIAGLRVAGQVDARRDGDAVRLTLAPLVPPIYNGSGATTPIDFRSVGAGAAATMSGGIKAHASVAPFSFKVPKMEIAGVKISDATVSHSGDDDWDVKGKVKFDTPVKFGEIAASVGIRNGGFGHLTADVKVADDKPGIPVMTDVYVRGVNFALALGEGVEVPGCVDSVGVKRLSLKSVRDGLGAYWKANYGWSDAQIYEIFPDYDLDYGVPDFQFCGGVTFRVGSEPIVFGQYLAEGHLGVGLVHYPDGRPGAMRITGDPIKVLGATGSAELALYSDGYFSADLAAEYNLGDIISLYASLGFQARFPKFNAQAYAEICILVVDACADATLLVSSKGMGACLGVDFVVEWTPGATVRWDPFDVTPYLDGCDVSEVKEYVKSGGGVGIKPVPPPGKASAASDPPPLAPGTEVQLELKAGLPGAIFAVKGQGGLPKFTLTDPHGATLSVDDQPSQHRILKSAGANVPVLAKNPRAGLTQVIVRLPKNSPAQTWKLRIDGDRPAGVRLIEGAPKPKIVDQRMSENGSQRQLDLAVSDGRSGMTVEALEAGASGGQALARFALKPGQVTRRPIRFTPANSRTEVRRVRLVFERNGFPVAMRDLKPFVAPAPPAPAAPSKVTVRSSAKGIAVSWPRVAGADHYLVEIRISDGRVIKLDTKNTSVSVRMPVARWHAAKAGVRAVSARDRIGPQRVDGFAARGKRKLPTITKKQRKALGG